MAFADRYYYPPKGSLTRNVVKLYGKVVTSTGGAISSQSCDGFSVALTDSEAGRYTVTLEDQYADFAGCNVTLEEADDAAVTIAEGIQTFVRNIDVTADTPLFYVQFVRSDTAADADIADGLTFYLEITLLQAPRPS